MTSTIADSVISIGTFQDRYLFKKKLGKGGFCDVFLAESKITGEKVAVKMMEMDPAGEKADRRAARFRREMQLYSQLTHPNIVKVLDSGETETGVLFIVFEYIHGVNLAQLLKKEGALSLQKTIDFMGQTASALNEAHVKGIIHRDLKPENIMVMAEGATYRIKVLDFGISTFIAGHAGEMARITQTREFLGTPSYAAPEQLRGEPVSIKVDIYAWGLLFLECITGKSPFTGTTVAAIVQQQLAPTPVPLPAAIVDHRLGTLLRWTLEKDVHRRAGNVAVIISHLEAVSPETVPLNNGYLIGDAAPASHENAAIAICETITAHQERRQVTVVCATLNVRQDANASDVCDEIYQDLMAFGGDCFVKFGAHVVTDTGDRILAFFGYPDASDTDARRAARSALELAMAYERRKAVFAVRNGLHFTYRIGIHTGMVTVRRDIGGKLQLSGLALNVTSKVCGAAEPDSIYISENSYLLLKDIVECREVGATEGSLSPVPVYAMIGERCMESLRELDSDAAASPMVGRDGEMARLHDAWRSAASNGIGKAILLQGEPGIGKSRLAAEFAKRVQQEKGGWMECRCLPEGKNSALHPILNGLRSQFGISRTAPVQDNVASLEHHLHSFGIDCTIGMPLFCAWLGLPADGHAMPPISPQRQKEHLLTMSSEMLARLAQKTSSVIMFEDLHWADPTTLEMLPRFFGEVRKRGLLLLMSARPVFVPAWNSTEAGVVVIDRLHDSEIEVIVRNLYGSDPVGRDTVAKIIARVDGVPLFAEEVTRLLHEKGAASDAIPATIRDLLTGKIDQLGPARETAQLASVIGRTFDYSLIEKVSLKDAASLLADLDQLISAGILRMQLIVRNQQYMFHHALVRDAAYDSLAKKAREEMHRRSAEVLEREFGGVAVSQPELLAHHWAGAGEFEKATEYGVRAATQYLTKSIYSEAISHATESLAWVPMIADEKVKLERELQLLQLLIPSYISTKGFAAPELEKINSQTEDLRKKLPDDSEFLIPILWGKLIYYHTTPDYKKMEYYMYEALTLGKEQSNDDILSALYSVKSHYYSTHTPFMEAVKYADISIEYYDKKKLSSHSAIFGHDSKVQSLGIKALALTMYGDIAVGSETMEHSIEFAKSIRDPSSMGLAFAYQLCMLHMRNEKDIIREYCDEFRAFINKFGLELWLNILEIHDSWATDNLEKVHQCLNIFQIIGFGQLAPYWNFIAAEIEYSQNRFVDCIERIEKCLEISNKTGEIYYNSELYRLKALCLARIDFENTKDIEGNFNSAINFAVKIESNLFKLRTLIDCIKTISNVQMKNDCIGSLNDTVNVFKKFPKYAEHYEVKDAIKYL